ncbi:MAG: hypothetical protein F4060_14010 [Holophagales bacterium]|nr:hypothetical protein [Holophagales bacterium]MYG30213.1 hypothetical protein [Holophagales bacterium]MYI81045.1 hypothetical protein [Holophagales bacterium]
MVNLLRERGWFRDVAADKLLLETVEGYGMVLEAKLADMAEEYAELEPLGNADGMLQSWWEGVEELIEAGLVRNKAPKEYALTHEGRVQLHSLRASEKQQKSLEQQQRSLELGLKRLSVALWALGASALFGLLNIALQWMD